MDDEELLTEAQRRSIAETKEELDYLLKNALGRRFLYKLLMERCGIDRDTFSVESSLSAFAQGRRSIGTALKQEVITHNLKMFLKMEEENYGR